MAKGLYAFVSVVALTIICAAPSVFAHGGHNHGGLSVSKRTESAAAASVMKPYIVSKLHDPKSEGVGYCKASATGTLQDFGEVDTTCFVHWSDKLKQVTGSYNDATSHSSIQANWTSCLEKAYHTETIKVGGKEVITETAVEKCGGVRFTIDLPTELDCTKSGTKWTCIGTLPDVTCDSNGTSSAKISNTTTKASPKSSKPVTSGTESGEKSAAKEATTAPVSTSEGTESNIKSTTGASTTPATKQSNLKNTEQQLTKQDNVVKSGNLGDSTTTATSGRKQTDNTPTAQSEVPDVSGSSSKGTTSADESGCDKEEGRETPSSETISSTTTGNVANTHQKSSSQYPPTSSGRQSQQVPSSSTYGSNDTTSSTTAPNNTGYSYSSGKESTAPCDCEEDDKIEGVKSSTTTTTVKTSPSSSSSSTGSSGGKGAFNELTDVDQGFTSSDSGSQRSSGADDSNTVGSNTPNGVTFGVTLNGQGLTPSVQTKDDNYGTGDSSLRGGSSSPSSTQQAGISYGESDVNQSKPNSKPGQGLLSGGNATYDVGESDQGTRPGIQADSENYSNGNQTSGVQTGASYSGDSPSDTPTSTKGTSDGQDTSTDEDDGDQSGKPSGNYPKSSGASSGRKASASAGTNDGQPSVSGSYTKRFHKRWMKNNL
ncbi:hypothetical protein CBS101457_000612 [Exobasidium rhododendri]|nr:hypothetical protein CBS101457_000612 [Exobasidium rhododendri]